MTYYMKTRGNSTLKVKIDDGECESTAFQELCIFIFFFFKGITAS